MVGRCPQEFWQQKCISVAGFTCWLRAGWVDLGEHVREMSAFYKEPKKDKLCCKLKNNSDHAKST